MNTFGCPFNKPDCPTVFAGEITSEDTLWCTECEALGQAQWPSNYGTNGYEGKTFNVKYVPRTTRSCQ